MPIATSFRFLALCALLCSPSRSLTAQSPVAPAPSRLDLQPMLPAGYGEDWATLKVDSSKLLPTSYAPIGLDEKPEFTRELIRIQWRPGDAIDLYVIKPKGVANPPVILYLYGYPSDVDRFRNDGWCKRATGGGFAAVGFVSALTGQRFAYRPLKEWFVSQLQEALGSSVHDVQLIVDYLQTRKDLQTAKLGMFGEGSGATIALLAASVDPRIQAVDALDPWGDWPDWFKSTPEVTEQERAEYLKPDFLGKLVDLDPVQVLPHLTAQRVRVQQVADYALTPEAARTRIAASVKPPQTLVQYRDFVAHREAWRISGLSGWLHDQLLPANKTAAKTADKTAAKVAAPVPADASPAPAPVPQARP